MNTALVAAAMLIGLTGLAHSVLGERFILIRLFRRDDLPKIFGSDWFTRRTLRFAWHLTTIAWWGLAVLLVLLARDEGGHSDSLILVIGITSAVSAVITAAATKGRHLAWIVFVAVFLLCWFAA